MVVPDGETNDVYFFAKDRRFSITALIDYSGDVVEFYEYSAFGLMTVRDPDWEEPQSGATAYGNQYGFTGRRWDAESYLWHYRGRTYSPLLGRFLQRDPSGFADGVNLYAYVANNPLRFLDPTGRTKQPWSTDALSGLARYGSVTDPLGQYGGTYTLGGLGFGQRSFLTFPEPSEHYSFGLKPSGRAVLCGIDKVFPKPRRDLHPMGRTGLEPVTSCVSSRRSSQLS